MVENPAHSRGKQVPLDPHLRQPREDARCRSGVHGRDQQVPGQRGLDRRLRRHGVSDLADDQDVGVVAQGRAQGPREVEVRTGIDLRLRDALGLRLDRVLDREDVEIARARGDQVPERRVDCRCLAARGGAGQKHGALGSLDQVREPSQELIVHPELPEADLLAPRVGETDDHLLPMERREKRDPQADGASAELGVNAAVLRFASLVDDEARHDLEALNDEVLKRLGNPGHGRQLAADPERDGQPVAARDQMHIARGRGVRLREQAVDERGDLLGITGEKRGKRRLDLGREGTGD